MSSPIMMSFIQKMVTQSYAGMKAFMVPDTNWNTS